MKATALSSCHAISSGAPCRVNAVVHPPSSGAETLLEWLRGSAGCTDVRQACDTGHCGACAVLVDGRAVKSCSVLAGEVEGREVLTLAGLESASRPAARAVLDAVATMRPFQCGYCQPAFVIAAIDLLGSEAAPSECAVREAFTGLLCRCTGYQSIVGAVLLATRTLQASTPGGIE